MEWRTNKVVKDSSLLIILGNQLFPIKDLKKIGTQKIFMAEDYGLCSHYKYHKHKIIFFLSAMRKYAAELQEKGFEVTYYDASHNLFKKDYLTKLADYLCQRPQIDTITIYEIEDKFFEEQIFDFCKKQNINLRILPSPMFLTSRDTFAKYLKNRKKPFMRTFYEQQRKDLSVLLDKNNKPLGGKWSYDTDNRKKMPKEIHPPEVLPIKNDAINLTVISFVNKYFSKNPGAADNFWLPTTRKETLIWLDYFIKEKLEFFGDYQDAITSRSDFVFHSVISPMLNAGLILPQEIIKKVEDAHLKSPKKYPLNAVEGFIRQVMGWREFVRGVYQNYSEEQWERNFWQHQKKLAPSWYKGTTGITILDDSIKKAIKYSYSHHIERLMILSNFMLLSEINPHEVHRWFMEMYSDSSDWVMGPNVFGMGQFSDGGIFATKPYICGSNYYLKMSDYKKGDWCDAVDGLYWRFIDKHKSFYKTNPRMAVMVKNLEKMDPERKKRIFRAAESFIEKNTL